MRIFLVSLDKTILSVKQLLTLPNLGIPAYQRPYKWTQKNLNLLFNDLREYRDKSAYRLGSVVFHQHSDQEKMQLDIVDGQQRTLTLLLIVQAIIEEKSAKLQRNNLKQTLSELNPILQDFMKRQYFSNVITHKNLHENYLAAKRIVSRSDFTEADIDFLLNRCQIVIFILDDVSEAFQFFDSQNARGRDLEPHDLLKAYHLREFTDVDNHLKALSVAHWEGLNSDDLARLFATYLYRIRQWTRGKSARYFGKNEISIFKGVNLDQVGHYPYVESLRIAHHYVDDYNNQYHRKIDHQILDFPFHLDQMVINGRRFFEMAKHYHQQISAIVSKDYSFNDKHPVQILGITLEPLSSRIVNTLNSYSSRNRTGDRYIRVIFDCAVVFYLDKFGSELLSQAIEKIFIWAYSCRLRQQVVQLATIDNYVLQNNVFSLIKHAVTPNELLVWSLESITVSESRNKKGDELITLFKEMKYYE